MSQLFERFRKDTPKPPATVCTPCCNPPNSQWADTTREGIQTVGRVVTELGPQVIETYGNSNLNPAMAGANFGVAAAAGLIGGLVLFLVLRELEK